VDDTPATPGTGPGDPGPQPPGGLAGGGPVLPDDTDRDGEVDVLFLAGQVPAAEGEWLLVTEVDGRPGADFTARVLPPAGRYAHGGDVLVRLTPAGTGTREPPAVGAGVWAVMGGLLVPVAAWDRQDPDGWPEQIRAAVSFAMGTLTELEDHGADLSARHRVHLDHALTTATAGIPAGVTFGPAAPGRPPGR
jgi:hypothetical protein